MLVRVGMGANAPLPMLVTLAGMLMLEISVLEKAWAPTEVRLPGNTMLPLSLLFSNALWPIDVSELGKVMVVSPVL